MYSTNGSLLEKTGDLECMTLHFIKKNLIAVMTKNMVLAEVLVAGLTVREDSELVTRSILILYSVLDSNQVTSSISSFSAI